MGKRKSIQKKDFYKRPDVSNSKEAIKLLKEGNKRFVNEKLANIDVGSRRRQELIEGQNPFAVIVSCSDSRVTPTIIFDQGLGDLFEIRTAGNVVEGDALGSIEYAVGYLNTPLVVVLGHQHCGAVKAAVSSLEKGTMPGGNMDSFTEKIIPMVEKIKSSYNDIENEKLVEKAVVENVKNVCSIISKSPIIKEKLEKKEVKIVGAKYFLDSGKVEFIDC